MGKTSQKFGHKMQYAAKLSHITDFYGIL